VWARLLGGVRGYGGEGFSLRAVRSRRVKKGEGERATFFDDP